MPGPYVIEEGAIIVTPRHAHLLLRGLRLRGFDVEAERIRARGDDVEFSDCLSALRGSALQWVEVCRDLGKFSRRGTFGDDSENLSQGWDSTEVAARAGCTSRAVTKAAVGGRLVGVLVGGHWKFSPEDAEQWMTTRRR